MKSPTRLQAYVERHRGDDGDTLVEILLALIVLGLSTVALMTAFSTTIAASAEHRSFATFDTVLRSASNEVISQIQGPSALYKSCALAADYQTGGTNAVAFSLPTGYTAQITAIQYWDGTQFQTNVAYCVAGGPQLLTVAVTNASGTTYSNTFAVDNPTFPTQTPPGAAYKLAFVTQPAGATAGSNFTTQPVVWVEDSNGRLVTTDLSSVKLAITGGTGTPGASLSNTCSGVESSGVVTFSNCSIDKSGTGYTLTATDGTLYPAVSIPFNVATGAVGSVSASCSTVTASPTSVRANGTSTSTITVLLCDSNGNGVANQTVVLSQGTGSSVISPSSATTNASGVATFTVKDSTPQTVTYTAKDTTYNVTVTQTAQVVFFGAPVSTGGCTSVTASPTSLLADGIQSTTITVKLCDTNGNPVTGVTVQLLQGSGSSAISPSTSTTDLTGTVQFTATDTTAQVVTYSARDTTDSVTVSPTAAVTFVNPHTPTAANSTVVANPNQQYVSYRNHGQYTYFYSLVTVTLRDSSGNPVAGKTVSLTDNSYSSGIQVISATTNSQGQATFNVYDTQQESVTYSATDTTDSVNVTQTAQVQYNYYGGGGN